MSEFIDPFPSLPQVVDIGGDRYFMGPQKPIELGFKSRKDFQDSFGSDRQTEYLVRRYLFLSLKDKGKIRFDSPDDKQDLIALLKKRSKQLEASKEFTSSVLKNTLIQRSYINIQGLIQELEGGEGEGKNEKTLSTPNVSLPCVSDKKYIREIGDDKLFQIILEIAWYLLHPDKVPSRIQCDWAKLIKDLDTLRIGDIISEIHTAESAEGVEPKENAFNYFKKINIGRVAKSDKMENALDEARRLALEVEGENANVRVKERLKTLLNILEMKKYLANDLKLDPNRMKIIDATAAERISKSMIQNPMRGGAEGLDKPLGVAMEPFFDYFRTVFDPVYGFVESSLSTYYKSINSGSTGTTLKRVIIPQLTTLLHICNNLNPADSGEGGLNTYGVYRITNVDSEIIGFINSMLKSTKGYLSGLADDAARNTFNQQLFELPKVRLTSLLNKFMNSATYKDPDTIPYIQFLTVGGNISLSPTKPDVSDEMLTALTSYFTDSDLYILCTKSENVSENIPMNVYQIDYDSVDVSEKTVRINNLPDNYFNVNKSGNGGGELHLEKLVTISPYVVYNDAELALSIFSAFKELMPK